MTVTQVQRLLHVFRTFELPYYSKLLELSANCAGLSNSAATTTAMTRVA